MKIPVKFKEYIWLVNTIRKARRISFADINALWMETDMSGGVPMARSTFNRHKDAIEDIFGLYIDCDCRNGYKYFISNDGVLREDSVQNWMLSTLSVSNIISESLSLQSRILLEQAPYEGGYLQQVIDAMKRSLKVSIAYRRYGVETARKFVLEPYCLKLHKKRWYVLGRIHRNATADKPEADYFATFSFDRILQLDITGQKFTMDADFDAAEYFGESFGIFVDDNTPAERVVLRAFGQERYYLRDLPLHATQQEIAQGEDSADFAYRLRPTLDFIHELMSRGSLVRVLQPQWLADTLRDMHSSAAQL